MNTFYIILCCYLTLCIGCSCVRVMRFLFYDILTKVRKAFGFLWIFTLWEIVAFSVIISISFIVVSVLVFISSPFLLGILMCVSLIKKEGSISYTDRLYLYMVQAIIKTEDKLKLNESKVQLPSPCIIKIPQLDYFEPDKFQVIYIENYYNKSNNKFFKKKYNRICSLFKKEARGNFIDKLRFEYLPKTLSIKHIKEIADYYTPNNQNWETLATNLISDFNNKFLSDIYKYNNNFPSQIAGFIRFKKRDTSLGNNLLFSYFPVDVKDRRLSILQIVNYIQNIADEDDGIRYSIVPPDFEEEQTSTTESDEYFDTYANQLIDEIKVRIEKLNNLGINSFVINKLLLAQPRLSRLHITADYRILLPDYDKEIKMTPLPKAVFFFFLRHPEGVIFKHLIDYKDELLEIYKSLSAFEDENKIEEGIANITDSTKNSINEKCSRIREAFVSEISEDISKNYFITAKCDDTNQPRKKVITLDRSLVDDESGLVKI